MEPSFEYHLNTEEYLQDYLENLHSRITSQCEMLGLGSTRPAKKTDTKIQTIKNDLKRVEGESGFSAEDVDFQGLIDRIPHYVAGINPNADILITNQAFDRFLERNGFEKDSLTLEGIIETAEDGKLNITEMLMQTSATGLWSEELSIGKESGKIEEVSASFFPNEFFTTSKVKFIAMFIDVSRQKEMTTDLIQAEVMRSIGMLAGGVAHHLNNLLVGVLGYASLLKPAVKEDKKLSKYVGMIENSASKAADLTKQLLSFSQRGESTPIEVDVNDALEIAISLVRKVISSMVEIKTDFDEENFLVYTDPAHLEHIILEICTNASHSMPEGGTLKIQSQLLQVNEKQLALYPGLKVGKYVMLTFIDNGKGIPPETLKDIFQPFYTTREFAARGLGLSSVYGLVQRYHGTIKVSSEVGQGTTFDVILPLSEDVELKGKHISFKRSKRLLDKENATLLIVDDEEMVLDFFASVLEDYDYQLYFANNGAKALEIYEEHHEVIDLVFMDVIMPKKNGVKTFYEMEKIDPNVRVILTSGYSVNEDLYRLIHENRVDFIQKPFTLQDFLDKLDSAFG